MFRRGISVRMEGAGAGQVVLGCASCEVRISVPAARDSTPRTIATFFGVHERCRTFIDVHDAGRDVRDLLPRPAVRRS